MPAEEWGGKQGSSAGETLGGAVPEHLAILCLKGLAALPRPTVPGLYSSKAVAGFFHRLHQPAKYQAAGCATAATLQCGGW